MRRLLTVLTAVFLSAGLLRPVLFVQAEEVINCWDETKKAHYLRRRVSTAINIYSKEGTIPRVNHESGWYSGVEYDILRVSPDENTFLKVDYSESPKYLNALYDRDLMEAGYIRVGGINAGYFANSGSEYGRPVGAVRVNNEWTLWHGKENTPSYGNGYATVYFNTYDMEIRYHGWKNGQWKGDPDWSFWTGYLIEAENAVSGSYTWFVDGEEKDITGGQFGMVNYRVYGRALTILAQDEEGNFLLLEFYGTMKESAVVQFLREYHVRDAIRLDGGGSCQMVYDDELVNLDFPERQKTNGIPVMFDRMAAAWKRVSWSLEEDGGD